MPANRAQVKIAARMYEAQETLQHLWGEKYIQKIQDYKILVRVVMKEHGLDVIPAAMKLLEREANSGNGLAAPGILAAVVEIVEGPMAKKQKRERGAAGVQVVEDSITIDAEGFGAIKEIGAKLREIGDMATKLRGDAEPWNQDAEQAKLDEQHEANVNDLRLRIGDAALDAAQKKAMGDSAKKYFESLVKDLEFAVANPPIAQDPREAEPLPLFDGKPVADWTQLPIGVLEQYGARPEAVDAADAVRETVGELAGEMDRWGPRWAREIGVNHNYADELADALGKLRGAVEIKQVEDE